MKYDWMGVLADKQSTNKRCVVSWVGKVHAHTHKEYTVIEIPCCIEPTVKPGIPEFHAEFLSKMISTVCV